MRFAFCNPKIALPTTTPDTIAVVTSCALWFAVAREIHDDISTPVPWNSTIYRRVVREPYEPTVYSMACARFVNETAGDDFSIVSFNFEVSTSSEIPLVLDKAKR
jgi:hypothetical protein